MPRLTPSVTLSVVTAVPTISLANRWTRLYMAGSPSRSNFVCRNCLYLIVFAVASSYKYETYQTGYDQIYFEQPLWTRCKAGLWSKAILLIDQAFAVDWICRFWQYSSESYWLLPSPYTSYSLPKLVDFSPGELYPFSGWRGTGLEQSGRVIICGGIFS